MDEPLPGTIDSQLPTTVRRKRHGLTIDDYTPACSVLSVVHHITTSTFPSVAQKEII